MDRKFTCPGCGHETAYDPRDCPRFLRFVGPQAGRRKAVVVRRVLCRGCGREHDVDAGKGGAP
jgi:transcription elongation factor Elf1